MAVDARQILDNIGNKEYLKALISDAEKPPSDARANQILIATMIYLAESLRASGEASEKHAKQLTSATRWLAIATIILAAAAIAQLCVAIGAR